MSKAPTGMIHLENRSAILHQNLKDRILAGKREPCEITFEDFDDTRFRITVGASTPSIVKVSMGIADWDNIKALGGSESLARLYPDMETTPDEEFDVAVEFDCESLPDPDAFLEDISCLRMHCLGAPIYKAFNTAMGGTVTDTTVRIIKYRRSGHMFVIPRAEKTVIGFLLSFNDVTDRAMAKIYLTEFLETSRTVRSATTPGIMFTKNVPPDLEGVTIPSVSNEEISGYVLFSFEAKQMNDESRDRAIRTLTNFRVYLHYHIKASKTYLHMRMRRRVTNWMQILNRAKPDRDLETKNMKGKKLNAK